MQAPLAYVFAPLSADDRWVLERFVETVEALSSSSFARSRRPGMRGTLIPGATCLGGPAWDIEADGADEEAVKAAIGDFRKLYTAGKGGNASATRVLNILKGSARERGTDAGNAMLDQLKALQKSLRERSKADPWGKLLEEDLSGALVERSPDDILKTWFNGRYFHDLPEPAAQLSPDDHGAVAMMRFSLQTAMRDHLEYWVVLQRLVARVLRDPALHGGA